MAKPETDKPQSAPAIPPSRWAALALILAAAGWSFGPNILYLIEHWNYDPNNSYGYFVVPIALIILYTRRHLLDTRLMAPSVWGLVALVVFLALRYPLFHFNEVFAETATIPLVVFALLLAFGGWHLVWVAWPAVLFLFFMLPVPQSFNPVLAAPLQSVATRGSLALLQLLGLPVVAEGNVLWVASHPLEVARACNGLSMLLSFVTLITAMVILVKMPLWERAVLLISAVPIALVSNILRIVATGVVVYRVGQEWADKMQAHDVAGWMMMPMALLLVWLEVKFWAWLFVEVDEVEMNTTARLRRKAAH